MSARAGTRSFWRLSSLRAQKNPTYKFNILWRTILAPARQQLARRRLRLALLPGLGSGRIVVSEIELPNLLAKYGIQWMSSGTKRQCDRALHVAGPRPAISQTLFRMVEPKRAVYDRNPDL